RFDFASHTAAEFAAFTAGQIIVTVGGTLSTGIRVRAVASPQAAIVTPADGAVIDTPDDSFTVTLDLTQVDGTALTTPSGRIVPAVRGGPEAIRTGGTLVSPGRYVFDFADGAFDDFGAGDITITVDGYTTTATVTARRVTTPGVVLVSPVVGAVGASN